MNFRRLVSLSLLLGLGGCAHERVLQGDSQPHVFRQANRITAGRDADVRTEDGQVWRWHDVTFAPDSKHGTVMVSAAARAGQSGPAPLVTEVAVSSRMRGMFEGLGIGTSFGLFIGFGLDAAFASCPVRYQCQEGAGLLYGIRTGALLGAALGALIASHTTVEVR